MFWPIPNCISDFSLKLSGFEQLVLVHFFCEDANVNFLLGKQNMNTNTITNTKTNSDNNTS